MKLHHRVLAFSAASAMLFAGAAHADAPTANLYVKGRIDVPTCTVSSPNDGTYDFGEIGSTMIKTGTATTTLDPKSQTWTASCGAKTYLSFSMTDNRKDSVSAPGSNNFGLGFVNDTGKLGYYQVKMENAMVDDAASNVYVTNNGTISSSTAGTSKMLTSDSAYKHGWAKGTTTQAMGEVFTADLVVTPTLAGSTTMNGPLTDAVDLDGSATLTFAFGL
ncbi:hypothetical protein WS63_19570 [Burkholderia stagnalis]|uniref:DUF1120 domain-containing protein n=1 Tax=Burkholderia stagnalis TaxID=1503054 RepID=UPI00075E7695|nr:DUF1120 domain-containing protein [Burkholderia stagnalis]KVD86897.1 hypothetical protein WS63_19570 [Burkholderia stagnalis]KVO62983.1 hypothetical protein WT18_05075 [Burkholderia stagnalis]KVP04484.1 hypothetical protein WT20_02145 [Burkholderia stagnalis]KVW90128.1 hypothetical protein WT30_27180 [Burkholderia stagnalis]KWH69637.1 hypothetical protein WT66_28815 [Burkholderia stagnalis]